MLRVVLPLDLLCPQTEASAAPQSISLAIPAAAPAPALVSAPSTTPSLDIDDDELLGGVPLGRVPMVASSPASPPPAVATTFLPVATVRQCQVSREKFRVCEPKSELVVSNVASPSFFIAARSSLAAHRASW